MSHLSHQALRQQLAACPVRVGERYRHYKTPDKTYSVIKIAFLEADDSLCIVYRADYAPDLIWVRPLANFLEQLTIDGQPVARFNKVIQNEETHESDLE